MFLQILTQEFTRNDIVQLLLVKYVYRYFQLQGNVLWGVHAGDQLAILRRRAVK